MRNKFPFSKPSNKSNYQPNNVQSFLFQVWGQNNNNGQWQQPFGNNPNQGYGGFNQGYPNYVNGQNGFNNPNYNNVGFNQQNMGYNNMGINQPPIPFGVNNLNRNF